MNTLSQNRYNMRYKQTIPCNRNMRSQDHQMHRIHDFNSPWSSQSRTGAENFWCETCDKGFMTRALLEYHIQRHQTCNIDGCQFVAHPKVITKHIQMQHATGLYKRIGKLDKPEEIKKWREERKRRYPTKENIEKRQAEVNEKIKRGEKMGLKHDRHGIISSKSGYHSKRQQGISISRNNGINNKKNTSQVSIKKRPVKKDVYKTVPLKEELRKLQPFKGIQDLVLDDIREDVSEKSNDFIEDDEDVANISVVDKTISNPIVCGVLSSLICSYESTDEEDIEVNTKNISNNLSNINTPIEPRTKIISNISKIDLNVLSNTICHNESENESGPEESTITKKEPSVNIDSKPTKFVPSRKDRLKKIEHAKTRHRNINLKRKLPSTLLEKLLHKEIQHERNVILQCIRYVVKNKYFDKS